MPLILTSNAIGQRFVLASSP